MALQIWLPLNGTTENKGFVGEIAGSNITFTSGGKIGKCLAGGTLTVSSEQAAQVNNNKEVSIAFWTYINADTGTTTGRTAFYGKNDWVALDNRKFFLTQYPNVNALHYSFQNDGVGSTFLEGTLENILPSYKWTHVAVVYQNPNLRIYINGELTHTNSGVSNSSSFAYTIPIIATSTKYLNDFRVYNHALSVKEVKELSKGLVAHYKLTSLGGMMPNLLPHTDVSRYGLGYMEVNSSGGSCEVDNEVLFNGKPTIKIKPNSSGGGGAINFYNGESALKANTHYCYSCYIRTNITDSWEKSSLGHFQTYNSSAYHNTSVEASGQNAWTTDTYKWRRVYQTFTTNADCWFRSYHAYFANADEVLNIADIKLEVGDYPTTWCPCETDDEYEEFFNDDGIEFDVSGNGYDLVKVGSVSYSSDSNRYSTCLNSINGSYLKAQLPSNSWLPRDAITVNLWVKPTTWNDLISCTESGGWNFEDLGNGIQFPVFLGFAHGYKIATSDIRGTALVDNNWHMLTGTFDSTAQQVKIYINGILKATTSTGTTNPISYAPNKFIIGGEAGRGEIPQYSTYEGGISDVRIYSTALSTTDIQELYKNGASVGKDGKCYSYEFIEI